MLRTLMNDFEISPSRVW
jgi:alpha-ketoglutarate-dependent taurine dioxygenase